MNLRSLGLTIAFGASAFFNTAVADASGARPSVERLTFRCDDGIKFIAEFTGTRARITVGANSYALDKMRSSFGRRYSSQTVAFMQDGTSAVLVGADGGPFRNCRVSDG